MGGGPDFRPPFAQPKRVFTAVAKWEEVEMPAKISSQRSPEKHVKMDAK